MKKALALALFTIALVSCRDNCARKQGHYAVGKYLYMDSQHRLHTIKTAGGLVMSCNF